MLLLAGGGGREAGRVSWVLNVECLSVFIPWPVASCQLPVVSRQSYWSRASHRLSGLAAYVHKHVCRGNVTHAEYVTSGSTWPKGYHVPRGQLINWRTKHLPVPHSVFSMLHAPSPASLPTAFIYLLCAYQSSRHNSPSLPLSLFLSIALALASLLSHIGYLRTQTRTHSGSASLPSDQIASQKSVKDVRRLQPGSVSFRALTRPPSPFLPYPPLCAVSTDVSG